MSIKITSSSELEKLLDALSTDLIRSIHYRELFLSVQSQIPIYPEVFAQSNTFWWHTLNALSDSSLHCLCRVYDPQSQALSLPNLLDLISENLRYFSADNFKIRLSANPFVSSLAEHTRTPDLNQLVEDIQLSSDRDPLVNKLVIWRNNLYGHRSSSSTLKEFRNLTPYELTWDEVKTLSERALRTYNHYQSLFKANTWSDHLIGKDDVHSLLQFAKSGLEHHQKNIKNKIAPHISNDPPAHA